MTTGLPVREEGVLTRPTNSLWKETMTSTRAEKTSGPSSVKLGLQKNPSLTGPSQSVREATRDKKAARLWIFAEPP